MANPVRINKDGHWSTNDANLADPNNWVSRVDNGNVDGDIAVAELHNWHMNRGDKLLDEISKQGILVWDANEVYPVDGLCMYLGVLYQSIVNGNTGNLPTDASFWREYNRPATEFPLKEYGDTTFEGLFARDSTGRPLEWNGVKYKFPYGYVYDTGSVGSGSSNGAAFDFTTNEQLVLSMPFSTTFSSRLNFDFRIVIEYRQTNLDTELQMPNAFITYTNQTAGNTSITTSSFGNRYPIQFDKTWADDSFGNTLISGVNFPGSAATAAGVQDRVINFGYFLYQSGTAALSCKMYAGARYTLTSLE